MTINSMVYFDKLHGPQSEMFTLWADVAEHGPELTFKPENI